MTPRDGSKQNTFFGGAAILAMGILVVKLIGMFYKIPLVNIVGAQGNTDFNNAYNIYAVLLTVSTAGLPVAVSKLVSEANAQGRRNQVRRIFRLALTMFLFLGGVSFLLMYFKADMLASMMHDTKAAAGIRALAPAVVCVGCLAALRGYTQGHLNMTPTSVSQIIEAACKLAIGLPLAWWLVSKLGRPPEVGAAGAITGVTVGTMAALVYMVLAVLLGRTRGGRRSRDVPDGAGVIIWSILRIAIPMTLSASMVNIITMIDSALVQGQLQKVLLENRDSWALYARFVDFAPLESAITAWKETLAEGVPATMAALSAQVDAEVKAQAAQSAAQELHTLLESVSRTLYGNYGGVLSIYNLPASLMTAITASVIPTVSAALARRDRRGASRVAGSALRFTALLAFPMGVGLFVLGEPIMALLFPALESELAGPLLSTLGIATIFVSLMSVMNSTLQAYDFVNIPILVMGVSSAVKIFTNYYVVVLPKVGIYGAPLGNLLCYGLAVVLDMLIISRAIPRHPSFLKMFSKPLAASLVMGGAVWAVYGLAARALSSVPQGGTEAVLSRTGYAVAVMGSVGVGMVIYLTLVVALRAISRQDLALMPKGDKIARLLRL